MKSQLKSAASSRAWRPLAAVTLLAWSVTLASAERNDGPVTPPHVSVSPAVQDLADLLRRGRESIKRGETQQGRALVTQVLRQGRLELQSHGESAMLCYLLGVAALTLDQNESAAEFLGQAVNWDRSLIPARIALARAWFNLGVPERGLDCLRDGCHEFPEDPAVKRALAEALYQSKKYDEAIGLFQSLAAEFPGDERVASWLLEMYKAKGRVTEADAGFRRLLERGEIDRIDYLQHMADTYLAAGNLHEVGRWLQTARREAPNAPGLRERFRRYYEALAAQSLDEKQPARAIIYLRRALEFAPDEPMLVYQLARAYAENAEGEKAFECYRAVLKSNPQDPQFFQDFAETLLALRRFDIATGMFAPAIEAARQRGDGIAAQNLAAIQQDVLRRAESIQRDLHLSAESTP